MEDPSKRIRVGEHIDEARVEVDEADATAKALSREMYRAHKLAREPTPAGKKLAWFDGRAKKARRTIKRLKALGVEVHEDDGEKTHEG